MIKIIEGDLFESKANFLVHQVNCQSIMGSGVAAQVADMYPHVEKDYRRYLKHCEKIDINPLGTAQYVPVDVWAVGMVDTIKNDNVVAYDSEYQYIVNLFGQNDYGMGKQHTDLNAMKRAMIDICNKAKAINATVAMPYRIGSFRGGAKWDDVYKIIQKVFENSGVNVEIYKYDRG